MPQVLHNNQDEARQDFLDWIGLNQLQPQGVLVEYDLSAFRVEADLPALEEIGPKNQLLGQIRHDEESRKKGGAIQIHISDHSPGHL